MLINESAILRLQKKLILFYLVEIINQKPNAIIQYKIQGYIKRLPSFILR